MIAWYNHTALIMCMSMCVYVNLLESSFGYAFDYECQMQAQMAIEGSVLHGTKFLGYLNLVVVGL